MKPKPPLSNRAALARAHKARHNRFVVTVWNVPSVDRNGMQILGPVDPLDVAKPDTLAPADIDRGLTDLCRRTPASLEHPC